MITPPLNPARKRQPKNQMNDIGTEQAKAQRQASLLLPDATPEERTAPVTNRGV